MNQLQLVRIPPKLEKGNIIQNYYYIPYFLQVEGEKNRLESLYKNSQSKIHMLQEQVEKLENTIKELSENPRLNEKATSVQRYGSVYIQVITSLKLSDKGCRVLASSEHLSLLVCFFHY